MIVKVPRGRYEIHEGHFGLLRWGRDKKFGIARPCFLEWYGCRDSFLYHFDFLSWREVKSFFYVYDRSTLAKFFDEIEDSLNLVFRSKFFVTDLPEVCCVEPSAFWRKSKMLMSLFSIFLRAAHKYKGDWKKSVYEHPYVDSTKDAVKRFFSGKTVYTGKMAEWSQQFDVEIMKEENYKLDRLLIEPSEGNRLLQNVGLFFRKIWS